MRELRAERDELGPVDEIPVDLSDFEDRMDLEAANKARREGGKNIPHEDLEYELGAGWSNRFDRPTPVEPIPACRIHVEKPVANYTFDALDCGSNTLSRILLVPDTHSPYEDPIAWNAMLTFAKGWKPDTIIHVGDLNDFYAISDHDRDPTRSRLVAEEAAKTRERRAELDDLGAVRKIITEGNHDYWLERFLKKNAPALWGLVTTESLIEYSAHGWIRVPYKRHCRVGNLHATHEVGYCGSTAVRNSGRLVGHNVVIGHCHRLGLEYFGTILGERYVSASLGWLGSLPAAEYKSDAEKSAWQHGFGTALMERNGDFALQLHPVVHGRVISL